MAAKASCDYYWDGYYLLSRYQGSRPFGLRLIDESLRKGFLTFKHLHFMKTLF